MSVRAKFKCNSIEQFVGQKQAKFSAVYSDKGENADFTKYTPSGELSILITDDSKAADQFTPGKCYYLTLEEAPE